MVASRTPLPVIGVPVRASALDGLDSLLSIVQVSCISHAKCLGNYSPFIFLAHVLSRIILLGYGYLMCNFNGIWRVLKRQNHMNACLIPILISVI